MHKLVSRYSLVFVGLMFCISFSVNAQTDGTESQDTCFATLWGIGADGWDSAAINTILDLEALLRANPETAYEADVNGDCVVNSDDYATIINCIFSENPEPELCIWNTPTCCSVIVDFPPGPCCVGTTGNVDVDSLQQVDISDLAFLIEILFINFPDFLCSAEANIDGENGIDIADLTFLVDHLYINFPPLPPCPE